MGDFGIKDALSSITSEALLEALAVIVAASLLILMVQKAVPVLAAKLSGKPSCTFSHPFLFSGFWSLF